MGLAPQLVEQIFEIVHRINQERAVSALLAVQSASVKEFYLGVGSTNRKSFRHVRSYKRRKRWLV